jgi:hypothetical protein
MNTIFKIILLSILILTLSTCQNPEDHSTRIIIKEYGTENQSKFRVSKELNLTKFKDWKNLVDRMNQVVCNDSIPTITFKYDSIWKKVYFVNSCPEIQGCSRDYGSVEILNDSFKSYQDDVYHLDSLPSILIKVYDKFKFVGSRGPMYYVCFEKNGLEKLPDIINLLTCTLENISDTRFLSIKLEKSWSSQKKVLPPPLE